MVEPEMAFYELEDNMALAEAFIKRIIKDALARCGEDMQFFKERVDGWLSLSGGRLGGSPGRGNFGAIGGMPPAGGGRAGAGGLGAATAALRELPSSDFSFIFETGEREMDEKGLPEASAWAAKFSCGPRQKGEAVVDTKAGYIYDGSRQNPPNPAWGLVPRPGTAQAATPWTAVQRAARQALR